VIVRDRSVAAEPLMFGETPSGRLSVEHRYRGSMTDANRQGHIHDHRSVPIMDEAFWDERYSSRRPARPLSQCCWRCAGVLHDAL
jgi:hypothetical protein